MTINDTAKAHHDQLFGGRVSTLARTDPEFIAYFDNFAFGETVVDAADLDDSVDLRTALYVCVAAPVLGAALTTLLPPSRTRTRLAPEIAPS